MIRFNITNKIVLLAVCASLFLGTIISSVFIYTYQKDHSREIDLLEQVLHQDYDTKIEEHVQIVISILEQIHENGLKLGLPEDSIKYYAASIIREAKYNNGGYFWGDHSNGQNVFIKGSDTEGTMRWDLLDAKGKKLLHEITKKALEGGGFSDYWWPRAHDSKPLPKRGYSAYYEPFNWVIGTGNYIDDIDNILQDQVEKTKKALRKTLFVLAIIFLVTAILIVGISIFIGRRLSKPIIYLSEVMRSLSGKENYSLRIKKTTKDEIGVLYDEFNSLLSVAENSRKALEKHQEELEEQVNQRTIELKGLNKELKHANKELMGKNEMIVEKNDELESVIHNLKETQSQLLQAEKMASLGTLTAGVSHEINNPLQYLSGTYFGLVSYFKKYGSEDEKTTDLLMSSTETAIDRISAIVKGLNQFSRDNEKYDEDCDIHSIINNCLTMLHNQIKHKAEISRNFHTNDLIVKGNVGKLHQVFINIITNSLHAIETKGEIAITTKLEDKNVIIEIIDNGCGISDEDLKKITEPFFTTKDPGKGTGLGLSITYSILQEHKGQIEFESELNKGTLTRIIIPETI